MIQREYCFLTFQWQNNMDHILPVLMKSMNLSYMSSGITGLGSSLRYFFKMFATECAVKLFSVVIVILPEKQFTGLSCQPKIMHKCFNMINTCITWWLTTDKRVKNMLKYFHLRKADKNTVWFTAWHISLCQVQTTEFNYNETMKLSEM